GRRPDLGEQVVSPVRLAAVDVEAVQKAGYIGDEQQAVIDGDGGDAAHHLVIIPEAAAGGDVALPGGVDGVEVGGARAGLGVPTVGDVHLVLPDHRRGKNLIARLRPDGILGVG